MSDRFQVQQLEPAGLALIQRLPIADQRGYFERVFCSTTFSQLGMSKPIVQINHTYTRAKAAIRGMHYQNPPNAESKFVTCLRGEVFDVAVDLRADSATFLKWHSEVLSATNHKTLYIPEGFAHGFQTLTTDCELLYLHTAEYVRASESGVFPADPGLGIGWPLPIGEMSERDAMLPRLSATYTGIQV